MRFERLHIPAFGPFTNLDLTFPADRGDLHVIYGANEAGKSSLLRAFRDLLFGIHGQSPDNFVHDYKKLRIRGEIVNQSGERLTFQRRKGNKNTLLDTNGNELPDNALIPFLGSVDQEYFSTMFGLGTRELREGAEQLLQGKGDIGNALFSASMGGTPIQLVLATLIEEAERLFKGRSTANVSIRPAVNDYKDLLRKSREAIVNPEAWENIETALANAGEAKIKLEDEISAFTKELEWIARCEDALPTVGRLSEEMRKLENLPPMPEVSSDFIERARAARESASETQAEVDRLTAQITKLQELLAGCQTSPALLADADALDRLHQDLGVYRDRKKNLTDLETEVAGLETTLQTGMQNLGLTGSIPELEKLRLNTADRLACEETAAALQNAQKEHEENIKKTGDLKTQIDTLETQLQTLPETDMTKLRDTLSVAAAATEANRTLALSESEVKRLTLEAKERHRELIVAPKDLDATGTLAVPTKATIRSTGEEMDGISRDIKSEEAKVIDGTKQLDSLKAELGRLERRGELPTEQSMHKAREHRDHGWSLVLADWKGDGCKEEFIPGTPLEEAFPQTILKADNIADQLREEAEAVAQAEERRFQITQVEKQIKEAKERIVEYQDRLEKCQASWKSLWACCEIAPQSPAEMEEWREAWIKFKDTLRQLRVAEEDFKRKGDQVLEATKQLAAVLSEPEGKGYTLLFDKARRHVQKGEETSGRRIELLNQIQGLNSQLETFEQNNAHFAAAVEAATKKWDAQCQRIGIPKDISPKSGLALLQERKELLVKFDSWKKTSTTLQKTKDAVELYEEDVKEKASALGAAGDTIEAQENDLWKKLAKARADQTRHEQFVSQIEEAKDTLGESQTSHSQAVQALDELIRLAKIETVDALEPLLANLELRNQSQSQIATFRDTLSGLARGQSVDDFLSRIRAEDAEALPQRKATIQSQKKEKETALQAVRDTLYNLKGQRQALEAAGDAAANYRQHAESCAARLRQDASRFVRLCLAAHFLQTQIERFRKENQGPLLEKSGQVFQSITRGAFGGLGAEFNADDTPILVGLHPDQTAVSIEGMSDGTRDQLYLALRLAALDQYLEKHEPMPLILDDLLITCDNDRAAAILPKLATLAQRTQIFLFTHHDHLVELCRNTLGEGAFHLHQMNTQPSAIGN
ncbi:MAG: AAA family ATPase [Syntrophobacterales bacterium]|nr:AAA family ATPase [Syntrophobacterales bacterium]